MKSAEFWHLWLGREARASVGLDRIDRNDPHSVGTRYEGDQYDLDEHERAIVGDEPQRPVVFRRVGDAWIARKAGTG